MVRTDDMKLDDITMDVDTSVHLVRHTQAGVTSYFVVVKCVVGTYNDRPDERLMVLRIKDEDPAMGGSDRDKASEDQMAISHLLFQKLIKRKRLSASFSKDDKNNTELKIDIPDSKYYLRPIAMENKHMRSMKFCNEHHAAAYAGDIIDAMTNQTTDWTKLSMTNSSMLIEG